MTRLAHRLVAVHDVDDVVQDALERAWAKWNMYDASRGSPTTWLLAITADRARATRRRASSRWRVADGTALGSDALTAAPAIGDGAQDRLADQIDLGEAVTSLPERQRLAVALHYFLDLPVAEVAAVMACSVGTVKSTLFDARTALRRMLGDDDDDV